MVNKGTAIVGFVLSFLAGMLLMWSIQRAKAPEAADIEGASEGTRGSVAKKKTNPGAVTLELYVMSQCPYGVRAVDTIKEVADKLGPDLDLRLGFIGKVKGNELTSMHGESEVKGDMVQACAAKHAPGGYLEMIACQNKNYRKVDTNWEDCARKAGLPVEAIGKCYNGKEGQELLKASFEEAKKKGARGSPSIFINGERYQGRRGTTDFMRAICNAYSGNKPKVCSDVPEAVPVNVTVLSDKRCADCSDKRLMSTVKRAVVKPVIKRVDYSDPEGKKLYEQVGGGPLPMAIFDETLEKDKEAKRGLRGLKPAGDKHKKLSMRASWLPECANDGGCERDECKKTLYCREEMPKTLEVFVMSQCPYGVRALNAMEKVLEELGSELDFRVHFIANGTADRGFKALHGQPEVDENIRELCAITHYGKGYKYMDYVLCRNKNIRSSEWESCTGDNGIATQTIKACFEGDEGKKLLEEDIKLANGFGIGASPTWITNGRYKFSGVDPATIKRNVCQHNKGMKGCK